MTNNKVVQNTLNVVLVQYAIIDQSLDVRIEAVPVFGAWGHGAATGTAAGAITGSVGIVVVEDDVVFLQFI